MLLLCKNFSIERVICFLIDGNNSLSLLISQNLLVINLLVKLYSLLICSIIHVHVLVTFRTQFCTKSYKQRKVLILKRVSITTNTCYSFTHDNIVEIKREMFYIANICIYNILLQNFHIILY